jgi:hypothetical protein
VVTFLRDFRIEGGEVMGGFNRLGETARIGAPARIKRALETMKARGVANDHCPRCDAFDWNVDLVDLPANSAMSFTPILNTFAVRQPVWEQATGALSLLSIVCKNCGYTMFHTLNVLEQQRGK